MSEKTLIIRNALKKLGWEIRTVEAGLERGDDEYEPVRLLVVGTTRRVLSRAACRGERFELSDEPEPPDPAEVRRLEAVLAHLVARYRERYRDLQREYRRAAKANRLGSPLSETAAEGAVAIVGRPGSGKSSSSLVGLVAYDGEPLVLVTNPEDRLVNLEGQP